MEQDKELLIRQRRMAPGAFVGFLIAISTIQWMALDVYLPALPAIRDALGIPETQLNMTLSVYVIAAAVGTLLSGPVSDKYGRKSILSLGMGLFIVFSMGSVFAESLMGLIVTRGVAGFGSGAVCTVAMAMIKDSFAGGRFQRAMTFLQSLALIGPIAAPAVGAVLISYFSWRDIFLFLALASTLSSIPVFFMDETLSAEKRVSGNILRATCGLFTILKNRGFTLLVLLVSVLTACWYSYMGVCSYIYIDDFGLSYFMYSLYYGIGAVVSFVAPFLYLWLNQRLTNRKILKLCFGMILTSGAGILLFGAKAPMVFFLFFLIFLLAEGMSRPLGMVILLDQREDAIGAASSVSNFALSILGFIGTSLGSLPWKSYIGGLGLILMGAAVIAIILCLALQYSGSRLKGLEKYAGPPRVEE